MASLVVLDGPLKGQRYTLAGVRTTIGRREDNDLSIPDGSISGTHCEIIADGEGFLLRDLDSTNGTRLNNNPVTEQRLTRNDIIMVGEIPVMIDGDDVPAPVVSEAVDQANFTRTTIVIPHNRQIATPKEFTKKHNSNKIWATVIIVLIAVIGWLLFKLIKGG